MRLILDNQCTSVQLDKLTDVLSSGLKVEAWDKARTVGYFTLSGRRVPRDAPGANFVVKQVFVINFLDSDFYL